MHRNGLLPVASPAPPWIGTSVPTSVRRIRRRLIAAVSGLGTVADQMRVRKYSFGNPDTNKGQRRKGGEKRKIPGGRKNNHSSLTRTASLSPALYESNPKPQNYKPIFIRCAITY
ncbi:hypothetical protein DAPPUDRAFT_259483 [Daphnia pulex]|uniref:Uncharacterized protein n=1 Tax=Daphnia pulex TaxID=6669 RepID=E9HHA6_DAPPU|nr:hypothetical protein DAPPUDRAFT_259483 [Daphnia pulex]|eukprot:EFX68831.1 hypothetical protein DAPPUDRAFT_259483 [Daphnia pulex]